MGECILQPCCWKFSHKLCSRLYSIEIEFYSKQKKQKKIVFEPPLGYLRSMYALRTLSIARWKARDGRLRIRNYTYASDVILTSYAQTYTTTFTVITRINVTIKCRLSVSQHLGEREPCQMESKRPHGVAELRYRGTA